MELSPMRFATSLQGPSFHVDGSRFVSGWDVQGDGTRRIAQINALDNCLLHNRCGSNLRIPLLSGFVSKSMIISAAGEEHLLWFWLTLLIASQV